MNAPCKPLPREDLEHILEHSRDLWEELRGQRIFITGGTGFFGMWLLESFLWANRRLDLGAQAVVLSRDPQAFVRKAPHLTAQSAISIQFGDVRDFEFAAGSFSHVIHAATEAGAKPNHETALLKFDTIVGGTRHTLDFALACGAQKLLLTSSGAVYGKQPPDMKHVSEDFAGAPDPLNPASAYGEGKRTSELLCALYHQRHGLETKIGRCFAFVGPCLPLDAHFAIGNFIRDALRGGPIEVKGDGTPYRSYLYAADLAIWLWTILFRGAPARPYNVGSAHDHPIAEIAKTVAEAAGSCRVHIAHPRREPHPSRYVPCVERARAELGLQSWIGLPEAVKRTLAFQNGRC